uniref:Uncharacterized protein n=1 Tax=Caenorhabditis japonica TaxID=281687 RepID=A0A8R1ECB7_CAEJA
MEGGIKVGCIKRMPTRVLCQTRNEVRCKKIKFWRHSVRPVELIKKSFTGCGLNNAPDGSDDGKISCFKNVTDMSGGIERLKQKRQENSVENLIDDININEDEEDAQSDISIDIQN